jgi:chemotaxis protein methyltransferase CheR
MREPEHFEYLKSVILPYVEQNNRGRDFNVWCAASSTGQEPYSLIMTIEDYFSARGLNWNVKLLATDIDTDVLKRAKDGIYSSDMLKDVKSEWMRKYFLKRDGDNFQVIDKLRNMIEFRQFNLMHPITAFKQYDLISCRNVMIYFDGETKNALVERFFDVTKEGGYFYIGHAESVTRTSRYTYVKPAVYRKITQGGAQKLFS